MGSSQVEGSAVQRTEMSIMALQREAQREQTQKSVNQLPVEFRQHVAEYYEALAEEK